jgi:hypothetical protein
VGSHTQQIKSVEQNNGWIYQQFKGKRNLKILYTFIVFDFVLFSVPPELQFSPQQILSESSTSDDFLSADDRRRQQRREYRLSQRSIVSVHTLNIEGLCGSVCCF